MDCGGILADRTQRMGSNAIREMLHLIAEPGMRSLAGGIPAPGSFPMAVIAQLLETVMTRYGSAAFQYDATEGFGPLRKALSRYLQDMQITARPEEILISSGSQGMLDALAKVLISPGDGIAVEAPTYLGALQAFAPYGPRYFEIDSDQNGIRPESLDAILSRQAVKLVYLVPTFQNPTGRTLPYARRVAIAEIVQRHGVLVVEDDPYSPLRYRGRPVAAIQTLAPENVVYISTLSKVFAPGLRVGFCLPPAKLQPWLVKVKQGVDLQTATFSQALAAEYITGGHLKTHLPQILALYAPKQAAMLAALERHFSPQMVWTRPEGGMFIWATGPSHLDMRRVYQRSVQRKVAFVPGTYFYARAGRGLSTMRLNFTMTETEEIEPAIATLAQVLHESLQEGVSDRPSAEPIRYAG